MFLTLGWDVPVLKLLRSNGSSHKSQNRSEKVCYRQHGAENKRMHGKSRDIVKPSFDFEKFIGV